jgi:integrase/recombinase XerD
LTDVLETSQRAIDDFISALWIEDGLAANSLAAYRRDLTLVQRLARQDARPRARRDDRGRSARVPRRAPRRSKATTSNRRLTVFRRYFRWALRERLVSADPTLRLGSAKQPLRVPKSLSEAQVEALLAAPDVDTPLGLRDRTMLELMYASGLRVSELVTLKSVHLSLSDGALRVTGKGAKERLVPFGEEAHAWLRATSTRRARDPRRPGERCALRHAPRRPDDAADVLEADQGARAAGGIRCRCRRTRCGTRSRRTC